MSGSSRHFLFILLVICLLNAATAGPLAYTTCIASCMGWTVPAAAAATAGVGGLIISAVCAVLCAPVLVAPTP